ncbi:MAG: hypothetical protein ABI445_12370 [Polyangia bacterium]
MRHVREILRQKWVLARTHREVAQSVGLSAGAVGIRALVFAISARLAALFDVPRVITSAGIGSRLSA